MPDYREIGRACRAAAKLYEAFKAGEEFASEMDQADHLIANSREALASVRRELDPALEELKRAKEGAVAAIENARAEAARLIAVAQQQMVQERNAGTEELQRLRTRQEAIMAAKTREVDAHVTPLREEVAHLESQRDSLVEEIARLTTVRDEARRALAQI